MMARKNVGEEVEQLMVQVTTSSVKYYGGSVMAWVYMATSGTGTLAFIDDVTQDRSS